MSPTTWIPPARCRRPPVRRPAAARPPPRWSAPGRSRLSSCSSMTSFELLPRRGCGPCGSAAARCFIPNGSWGYVLVAATAAAPAGRGVLLGELGPLQLRVQAARREQLSVRAALADPAAVDHQDLVGLPDG